MIFVWTAKTCILLILFKYINGTPIVEENNEIIEDDEQKTPFTMDEFLNNEFLMSQWNGTWLKDNTFIFKHRNEDIYKFDPNTKQTELFLKKEILDNYPGALTYASSDDKYIVIKYNVSYGLGPSSNTASYALYDIANGVHYDILKKSSVQTAVFDKQDSGFAYVHKNNIYYLSDVTQETEPIQITHDGVPGLVFNGMPGSEGIPIVKSFGEVAALWFSPNGDYIAYVKMNLTNVKEYSYLVYGTPGDPNTLYPLLETVKYSKAGTPIPLASVFLFNVETKVTTKLELIDSIKNTAENNDYIVHSPQWVSDSAIAMISTNRVQNESVIIRCNTDGDCEEEVSYKQENGWLEPFVPMYNKNGTKRLEILPQPYKNDQFFHLVLTDVSQKNSKRLTYGNRVVTSIDGWDQTSNLVYYTGSVNDTPSQQHVYVVNTETNENKCLTCNFVVDGEKCKFAYGTFNKEFTHYVKTCLGPNPTYTVIQNIKDEDDVFLWDDNANVKKRLANKLVPDQMDLRVPVGGNCTARVRLFLPPNMDKSKKYPAIVDVYAGPGSTQINDQSLPVLVNYYVTNRRYIYIYIDGRGSGKDGLNKLFQVYRRLGTVEVEDQIAVTKYLQENYSFIDRNNTGIWGWSYGGFASSMSLIQDKEHVFKFAVSGAPVSNYIYYDAMFAEKYMGLPTREDNLLGYQNTDLSKKVENLRGKLYFIIHGTADDNVHYQQTLLFVKALQEADISFILESYTDEKHAFSPRINKHLYHSIDNYWARAFGIEP